MYFIFFRIGVFVLLVLKKVLEIVFIGKWFFYIFFVNSYEVFYFVVFRVLKLYVFGVYFLFIFLLKFG